MSPQGGHRLEKFGLNQGTGVKASIQLRIDNMVINSNYQLFEWLLT